MKLASFSLGSLALGSFSASCAMAAPTTPATSTAPATATSMKKFDFGSGTAAPGTSLVSPDTLFTEERGYGFEPGATVTAGARGAKTSAQSDFLSSTEPFYFSANLPEGNYNVTVTLGGAEASDTTVKAESRRLMLEKIVTKPGEFVTRTFTVNIRNSTLKSGLAVRLKDREKGLPYLHWDNKLTLEFNGPKPSVASVDIAPAPDAITVYLAGDSTVTDQTAEPWNGWGQMLPRFFKPGVAISNHAESGEALSSFNGERRFQKIFDTLKKGDYLFIQFGHNDMKNRTSGGGFGAYSTMLREAIAKTRAVDAIPVLLTPMHRRRFDEAGKVVNTLEDYPDAVRKVATDKKVALIDLNAMSAPFYEALGPEKSLKAFVHYPANTFPGQTTELKDNTHFNAYGGYQLAKAVVEGIKSAKLGLAAQLADDVKPFDPAHPDSPDTFVMPLSASVSNVKPDGN
ncbi:MAG TPA: rhamnogalacturonan acetylesterase [Abditibacterium sp.]|jgi:lysophospholipase L1-like esterase